GHSVGDAREVGPALRESRRNRRGPAATSIRRHRREAWGGRIGNGAAWDRCNRGGVPPSKPILPCSEFRASPTCDGPSQNATAGLPRNPPLCFGLPTAEKPRGRS